jgi:hypothetical protein
MIVSKYSNTERRFKSIGKTLGAMYLSKVSAFIGMVVVLSIWWAPLRQYWIYVPSVSLEAVQEAVRKPGKEVLEAAASVQVLGVASLPIQQHKAMAQDVMNGVFKIRSGTRGINIPFSVDDIVGGDDSWQLTYSGLVLPGLLLNDFERNGNRKQLLLARDMIVAFIEWEKGVNYPTGFVWNDHALASRIAVLTWFWRHYREDQTFSQDVARKILQAVERTASRLGLPSAYTYNTNHGVMQNIALLQASVAFPMLPSADTWGEIARRRLTEQMGFYTSQEGFVLEHSMEYHLFGMYLLASAISLDKLSGPALPAEWIEIFHRGMQVARLLRRPDGSMPVYGDSHAGPRPMTLIDVKLDDMLNHWSLKQELYDSRDFLFPVSGLAGWSTVENSGGTLSQTTASWSYFPGHGHLHADELSLGLWLANGFEILNAGYWPYGLSGRASAESWIGGNAPHFVDEPTLPKRPEPALMNYILEPDIHGLNLHRFGNMGEVQRQLFQIGSNAWVVLDIFDSHVEGSRGEVVWRVSGAVEDRQEGRSVIWRNDKGGQLTGIFLGSDSIDKCVAGVAFVEEVRQVGCVKLVTDTARSPLLSYWSTVDNRGESVKLDYHSPRQWTVSGLGDSYWHTLSRKDDRLFLQGRDGEALELALKPTPDVAKARSALTEALSRVAERTPKFREVSYYRWRVTYIGLALLAMQITVLWLLKYRASPYTGLLNVLGILFWTAAGIYLNMVYFVVD